MYNAERLKVPYCKNYIFKKYNTSGVTEPIKWTSTAYKKVEKNWEIHLECDDSTSTKEYEEITQELKWE